MRIKCIQGPRPLRYRPGNEVQHHPRGGAGAFLMCWVNNGKRATFRASVSPILGESTCPPVLEE